MSSSQFTPPSWLLSVIRSVNSIAANYATPEDNGQVLAFMGAVFPGRPEVVVAQARVMMMLKNVSEARTLLADSERMNPTNSAVKAMTALCLYMQNDPIWEAYAQEASALPATPIAKAVVERLAKATGKSLGSDATTAAAPAAVNGDYFSFQGLAC